MTHNQQDVTAHHEGDTVEVQVTVEDENGTVKDLTGASAEWLLLENETDDDVDALLTKSGDEGGTGDQIEFTDASNGELTVHIDSGDTEGLITWGDIPDTSVEYHHRIRVTDANDRRVTGFTGNFEILP